MFHNPVTHHTERSTKGNREENFTESEAPLSSEGKKSIRSDEDAPQKNKSSSRLVRHKSDKNKRGKKDTTIVSPLRPRAKKKLEQKKKEMIHAKLERLTDSDSDKKSSSVIFF